MWHCQLAAVGPACDVVLPQYVIDDLGSGVIADHLCAVKVGDLAGACSTCVLWLVQMQLDGIAGCSLQRQAN